MKELKEEIEKKKIPILKKRDEVICGTVSDFEEYRVTYGKSFMQQEARMETIEKTEEEKALAEEVEAEREPVDVSHLQSIRGIPDYWVRSIRSHAMLASIVSE